MISCYGMVNFSNQKYELNWNGFSSINLQPIIDSSKDHQWLLKSMDKMLGKQNNDTI